MKATELRKGVIFEHEGSPWRVTDYQNRAMGRGAGVVVVRLKNLITGNALEKTFRSTDSVDPAEVERVQVQHLYKDGRDHAFMNQTTYDQDSVSEDILGDSARFLADGAETALFYYKGKPIGLDMPNSVFLTVTQTEPGVRGDTATAALKPATLETGVVLNVPLFINQGDVVKVDTRTGQYLERQK